MFSFELQRRARVYVVGRKGRNALYVTFAIYVQGAKRTSCNNEFKYFVVFDTIFFETKRVFWCFKFVLEFPLQLLPLLQAVGGGLF